jgi:hypothetical protein
MSCYGWLSYAKLQFKRSLGKLSMRRRFVNAGSLMRGKLSLRSLAMDGSMAFYAKPLQLYSYATAWQAFLHWQALYALLKTATAG